MGVCVLGEGSASHQAGELNIGGLCWQFVDEQLSIEHKGHVCSKFSGFNLIWLVNYKYSACKSKSTLKKSHTSRNPYTI